MAQVLITKSKLDTLAQTVATKASISLPLSIDDMNTAIANLTLSADYINLQNKDITPTKAEQSVTADTGYDGLGIVTIAAIPNNYVDTSGATATAADVVSGKTLYVNNRLTTGTLSLATYYTGSSIPDTSLGNNGDLFFYSAS